MLKKVLEKPAYSIIYIAKKIFNLRRNTGQISGYTSTDEQATFFSRFYFLEQEGIYLCLTRCFQLEFNWCSRKFIHCLLKFDRMLEVKNYYK